MHQVQFLSPFDSWLLIRGMKTLALRMRQHEENAKAVVAYLNDEDGVTDVFLSRKRWHDLIPP